MSTPAEVAAASAAAPIAGDVTAGPYGVLRYVSSATAASIAIPASWRGKFVEIASVGCNTQYAYSVGAGVTLVYDQESTVASPSGVAGRTIASGSSVDRRAPGSTSDGAPAVYLNIVSDSGSGYVEISMSEVLGQ